MWKGIQSDYSLDILFSLKSLHEVLEFRYLIQRQRGYTCKGLRVTALAVRNRYSSTVSQIPEELNFMVHGYMVLFFL